MQLPSFVEQLLPKKPKAKEVFSSLVITPTQVAAALWQAGDKGVPDILAIQSGNSASDSWEARLDAIDEALASVEDKVGTTSYTKVVLGLPVEYLTEAGEIRKDLRVHMKTIMNELELTPIGFVSIAQSLLFKIKKDEGVPPSVILLDVSDTALSLSVYRVGALTGQVVLARNGDIAINVEEALKQFKDLEVLPARILLYGNDQKKLEDVKTELLRYPWTTKVNFLHFPKMEIISTDDVAWSVSLAGASELAHEVGEIEEPTTEEQEEVITAEAAHTAGEEVASTGEEDSVPTTEEQEAEVEGEDIESAEEVAEEEDAGEASNVVTVDPSRLGFQKNVDVLEEPETTVSKVKTRAGPLSKMPSVRLPSLPTINMSFLKSRFTTGGKWPLIGVVLAALVIIGLLYWFVPHATVTIIEMPREIDKSETITIDPTATVVDAENKIIPGAKQSQSVNETKTIAVTGTKNVGDPAKGTVTIYNKNTSSDLPLTKGTQLTSGSLTFTLDTDIDVASASTNYSDNGGSTTFGTATVNVTASQIGPQSNVPAGTTFTVSGESADVASARNALAFSGGTSKTVTVVTRADYDALVAAAQKDLVSQAESQLTSSVGTQKLIPDTVETDVTDKTFTQELDQQATQLTGKVTITVSGVSFSDDDVKTLMKAFILSDVPQGYALADARTQVSLDHIKVGKDGKISAVATVKAAAVPTLDKTTIRQKIAGKSISATSDYLKSLTGVASIEVHFGATISKSRLPANANNISVTFTVQ